MTAGLRKTPAACRIPICRITPSNSCARWPATGRATVFLIENNHSPLGMVGIDWREPDAPELGYWLGVEHWGQGFGTEAARAAIDFFFEEFDAEH